GKELRALDMQPDHFVSMTFAPDGKTLAARGGSGAAVRLYDVATGTERTSLGPPGGLDVGRIEPPASMPMVVEPGRAIWGTLVFSADSRLLAALDMDEKLRVWDVTAGGPPPGPAPPPRPPRPAGPARPTAARWPWISARRAWLCGSWLPAGCAGSTPRRGLPPRSRSARPCPARCGRR